VGGREASPELDAVAIGEEDRLVIDAAVHDMVDAALGGTAMRAWHGLIMPTGCDT
jgi:hypothetical protein